MSETNNENYFDQSRVVKELTAKDFNEKATWELKKSGCTFVLFYAPWCPHCKAVKSEWEKFAKISTFVKVAAFNCEKQKTHLLKIREDMPNLVTSYPTIIFYKNSKPVEAYNGERTSTALLKTAMELCDG